MKYDNVKIYHDGSHFIAIGKDATPVKRKNAGRKRDKSVETVRFETAYRANFSKPKKERKAAIREELKDSFKTEKELDAFVDAHSERMNENAIKRRIRMRRKLALQDWNYFCTFTYSDELHTEESFQKTLSNTLKHLVARKGWKYIGVWERSPGKNRLHFHGIFVIPEMIGTLDEIRDYSTKDRCMQTTLQNSHFLKHFGRNDFKPIGTKREAEEEAGYMCKYLEKTGARIVYGGKLPTYLRGDVLESDRICPYGVDDRKSILADDFHCIGDGEYFGRGDDPEAIEKMPKSY